MGNSGARRDGGGPVRWQLPIFRARRGPCRERYRRQRNRRTPTPRDFCRSVPLTGRGVLGGWRTGRSRLSSRSRFTYLRRNSFVSYRVPVESWSSDPGLKRRHGVGVEFRNVGLGFDEYENGRRLFWPVRPMLGLAPAKSLTAVSVLQLDAELLKELLASLYSLKGRRIVCCQR